MRRDVIGIYNMPEEVKFCKLCTVSNQRPRITFDENDVCSACHFAECKRNQIAWDAPNAELLALCDEHHKDNGEYDVIAQCSGGKDGSFVAPTYWVCAFAECEVAESRR